MAFTALRTWVTGEVVTAAHMNEQIKDNGNEYLQRDGSIPLTTDWDVGAHKITAEQIESDVATTTAPLIVASTTVVTNLNADQVDGQERALNINADHTHATTGAEGGQIDHGAGIEATSLLDDDHTIYQKESEKNAANGYCGLDAGGLVLLTDLPALTTGKAWKGVAGRPAEVDFPSVITSGTYTGDDSANRAIAHGLGATPKLVFILSVAIFIWNRIIDAYAAIWYTSSTAHGNHVVTVMDATNFYVGNAADYGQSGNADTRVCYWVAIV